MNQEATPIITGFTSILKLMHEGRELVWLKEGNKVWLEKDGHNDTGARISFGTFDYLRRRAFIEEGSPNLRHVRWSISKLGIRLLEKANKPPQVNPQTVEYLKKVTPAPPPVVDTVVRPKEIQKIEPAPTPSQAFINHLSGNRAIVTVYVNSADEYQRVSKVLRLIGIKSKPSLPLAAIENEVVEEVKVKVDEPKATRQVIEENGLKYTVCEVCGDTYQVRKFRKNAFMVTCTKLACKRAYQLAFIKNRRGNH